MPKLKWDATGEHFYETGVRNGVLYVMDNTGKYPNGVVWNGLTAVTESPTGADTTALYADDQKYLNLIAAEDFEATIEAYTYPKQFGECDGSAQIATGIRIGQQSRKTFGLSYRTILGNDVAGDAYGYKIHLIYGAVAAPSEKAYETVNDSPDAITFSWELSTTPVPVTGYKATASLEIDSTDFTEAPEKLALLEAILYGADAEEYDSSKTYKIGDAVLHTESTASKTYIAAEDGITGEWDGSKWLEVATVGPRLPLPDEIIELMA